MSKDGNEAERVKKTRNSKKKNRAIADNIFKSVLSGDEAIIWDSLKVDAATQIDYDLKILTIRERRMLERIRKLEECAFMEVKIIDTEGSAGKRTHTQRVVVSEASLVMIQQIEAELTRIQEKKARMLDVKHKYESTQHAQDEADVAAFVNALSASVGDVWDEEGDTDGDETGSE